MQANQFIDGLRNQEPNRLKEFDTLAIGNFQDEIRPYTQALRAFGALLESADLSHKFGSDWDNAGDYREGLGTIIDMCLEKQEQMINALGGKYENTPEFQIKRAHSMFNNIKNGMFSCKHTALKAIGTAVGPLDRVVNEFGGEAYPQAIDIKKKLMGLADELRTQMNGEKQDDGKPDKKSTGTSTLKAV